MKVRLYTSDYRFVHDATTPPFNAAPDIIVWGERFFRYERTTDVHEYREGFTYFLVEYAEPAKGTP